MDTSPGEDGDSSQRKSKAENCSGDEKHAVVGLVAPDGRPDHRRQKALVESGLQISLKKKLRSEAKTKFPSGKIAKRSEAKTKKISAKGKKKHAVVVLVAPDGRPDNRLQKDLVESLKKEGISPEIIIDSKMSDSKKALAKIIGKITTKIENLIVVVVADGFYHDDGEAIIFKDCYVLLDTFIHEFVAVPKSERKYEHFLLASFHPRKYGIIDDDEYGFETSIFRSFLTDQRYFNLIDTHLINEYGEIKDIHVVGFPPTDADKLEEWQDKFPDWLKNEEFKKLIFFLYNEEKRRREAKAKHQRAVENNELTWAHAKTDTMKLFFYDRDESPRDLEQYEHDEKFNRYINFIKQMTEKKEKRNFDKFIKDLHFTHSLTTDIFNFSPRGKIVTGCMVVNKFDSNKVRNLDNNDEKVFSKLFSKEDSILFAGVKEPQKHKEDKITEDKTTRDGKTEDEKIEDKKTEDGRTEVGRVVRTEDCINFISEMRREIEETGNISAIVLYISSHGYFSQGGKFMCLSDANEPSPEAIGNVRIVDLLDEIFVCDGNWKKTSSIPKIIFVDTCHGNARNHLDVFSHENPLVSKSTAQDKNANENTRPPTQPCAQPKPGAPPAAGGLNRKKGLENFIILHASVQQNGAFQNKCGSYFLDVLKNTINESSSKNENSLGIMEMSFDLVKNIEKVEPFSVRDSTGSFKKVKLMCEADVQLHKNYRIRIKRNQIDSNE